MKTMRIFSLAACLTVILLFAAQPVLRAEAQAMDEKTEKVQRERVLRQLDDAAKNFKNTSADFQFDSHQTDPVPDDDVLKGTVYYQRDGKVFQMAAHMDQHNGQPIKNIYTYTSGVFRLYEGATGKVTANNKVSQYENYFLLGFGASGHDLEDKWDIKYVGSEVLDGVKTEKLELIAKDASVRKLFPKVTVSMDTQRGVSLKQIFEEPGGEYRVSVYFNFKLNASIPKTAFTLPADAQSK
jgi:outer membrane lipoprotein-sorting protein